MRNGEDEKMEKNVILENYSDIKKEIRERNDDLIQYICDYSNGYICDIIMEISDSQIDIYTEDLFEWAKHNLDVIEEANNEFGTPNDIIKQIQQAEYLDNSNNLYNMLEDMLMLYAYNYLEENEILLTDEELIVLEERLKEIDNNNRLSDIDDLINNIIEEREEKGEE